MVSPYDIDGLINNGEGQYRIVVHASKMFPGPLNYSSKKILLSNAESHGVGSADFLTHDECLKLLTNCHTSRSSVASMVAGEDDGDDESKNAIMDKIILIRTNYAWVFKSVSELTDSNIRLKVFETGAREKALQPNTPECQLVETLVKDHKILAIPPLRLMGPRSLIGHHQVVVPDIFGRGLQQTILLDKYAYFYEMLSIMVLDGLLTEKAKNSLVSSLIYRNKATDIENELRLSIGRYSIDVARIKARVNYNVRLMRHVCSIPMRNDRPIISFLQGRDSEMRSVIPKRVNAFRAQVVLNPALRSQQMTIPVKWAHLFSSLVYEHRNECQTDRCLHCRDFVSRGSLKPVPEYVSTQAHHSIRVYDPATNDDAVIPRRYVYKLRYGRIVAKRDPVINMASFSTHSEVIFIPGHMFNVGLAQLENKNEDIDGDTEIEFQVLDKWASLELDLNATPEFNMLIYQQPRITFTESLILYMHRRQFGNTFRYAKLYKWIRRRETYQWLSNAHNRSAIERIAQKQTDKSWNAYSFAEPTRHILMQTLIAIAMVNGSREALWFYNFIQENVLRLANEKNSTENPLYDPNLPADYTMSSDLLNESLMAICSSEARGCVESYDIFLRQLMDLDGSTDLSASTHNMKDEKSFFGNVTSIMQSMAKKSRLVRVNGHNFFKTTIGYETFSFHDHSQSLIYNGHCILHNFEMLDLILLPPHVAALLTFCPEYIL